MIKYPPKKVPLPLEIRAPIEYLVLVTPRVRTVKQNLNWFSHFLQVLAVHLTHTDHSYSRPHLLLRIAMWPNNSMNCVQCVCEFNGTVMCSEWTDNFPYDFREERMTKCLKDMTQLLVNIYPELRRDVGILMHNLFSKVCLVKHVGSVYFDAYSHLIILIYIYFSFQCFGTVGWASGRAFGL